MKIKDELLKFEKKDGCIVIKIMGDIDHHGASEYKRKIDSYIFIEQPKIIFLDLSSVSFMDSSGLGLIFGRYRLATEVGSTFKILNPNENVMKILKIAGCERILEIVRKKDFYEKENSNN